VRPEDRTIVDETAVGPPLVEEEERIPPQGPPPGPPRGPLLWPWLLLLLVLVAGGLVAAWLLTRGGGHHRHAAPVAVPNVIGQKQADAVARLNSVGLVSRISSRTSAQPAGTVFGENPGPGASVTRGSTVTLLTSSAAVETVPDVVGSKVQIAVAALRAKGLTVQTTSVNSSKPNGTVVAQSPAAGTKVGKGSTESIRVSRGLATVPDVTGQTQQAAIAAVRGAGLVATVFHVPSTQGKGTVVAQHPSGGKRVARGSKVRLNVAQGSNAVPPPPPTTTPTQSVPDVTGEQQAAAQRDLNASRFDPGLVYVPSDQPEGTIVAQSPQGGTTAKRGTHVQINASLGPNPGPKKTVPGVLGQTAQTARSRLEAAGFKVQELTRRVSSKSQNGLVVDEQPSPGRRVPARSTVTIYLGSA
jgi:beta-lactam-binding protein with PASTA domain